MEFSYVDQIGEEMPKVLFSNKPKCKSCKRVGSSKGSVRKIQDTETRIHELKKELGIID